MNNIIGKKSLRLVAGGALMVFAGLAHAQYLWLNEKGSRVYSDQPPPSSIPLKNILKSPGAGAPPPEAAPAAAPAAPKAGTSLAEREAEFKKRATERAAAEQQSAADAAQRVEQKRNCDLARAQKSAMDAGEPITERQVNGERTTLSDAKLVQERVRNDKVLAACK